MSLKIVVDMNLSPDWALVFQNEGWPSAHWSMVGDPKASDQEIMGWALAGGYLVFTHDLDFGTTLALTRAIGPSVVQLRSQDVIPSACDRFVVAAIRQHESELLQGAILVVDDQRLRVRILPIK
jgi:predicted nuclease of predicted toxin-antitoxin system